MLKEFRLPRLICTSVNTGNCECYLRYTKIICFLFPNRKFATHEGNAYPSISANWQKVRARTSLAPTDILNVPTKNQPDQPDVGRTIAKTFIGTTFASKVARQFEKQSATIVRAATVRIATPTWWPNARQNVMQKDRNDLIRITATKNTRFWFTKLLRPVTSSGRAQRAKPTASTPQPALQTVSNPQ
jgi:hypothetical protein